MAEFGQNGLKIFKIFRWSQQSTTWQIRDPATVDFSRESWPYCRLLKKNPTTVDFSNEKSCNSRFIVKSRLSTAMLGSCHLLQRHQRVYLLIFVIFRVLFIISCCISWFICRPKCVPMTGKMLEWKNSCFRWAVCLTAVSNLLGVCSFEPACVRSYRDDRLNIDTSSLF